MAPALAFEPDLCNPTEEHQLLRETVRDFTREAIEPQADEHDRSGTLNRRVFEECGKLGLLGITVPTDDGGGGMDAVAAVIAHHEMSKSDPGFTLAYLAHAMLFVNNLNQNGSDEQRERWLPDACAGRTVGGMCMTEPASGTDVLGMQTNAVRQGDHYVLNGAKMWITNGAISDTELGDVFLVYARTGGTGTRSLSLFVVEKGTPGFSTAKMQHKMALRVVQNADITLQDCRVADENRLANARSFKDTAAVLRMTRAGVAWESVGCAQGAYEHALRYACQREQFDRPIARFQLVQDLLVRMLSNVTASQCMVLRLSQLQDAGLMREEHASLAKAVCTVRARETVGWARELLGGNGILLDHHVARFVADAEAIYSYEGTREINALVVGRAITGFGAFV
jgi:glutaryl-CoA dehydrogenase